MPTDRVMVRPMDDPAFLVPDILAVKADAVAFLDAFDSRGDVNVVCHKHCLSRRETNDESLVLSPVQIIWQNTNHPALAFDLYIAGTTLERTTNGAVVGYRCCTAFIGYRCCKAFSSRTWTDTRDGDKGEKCTGRNDENRLHICHTGMFWTTVVLSFRTIREVLRGANR